MAREVKQIEIKKWTYDMINLENVKSNLLKIDKKTLQRN